MDNYLNLCETINEILTKEKITTLKKGFEKISNKYRAETADSSVIVTSDKEVLTYISSRMGETAIIVDDVLKKVNSLCDIDGTINKVLDLGSGTGSCLWAIENYIENAKIVAVEREPQMIKYSKLLCKDLKHDIEYIQSDVLSPKVRNLSKFDLVIESFMLNEIEEKERMRVVDVICEKSDDYIILVEPGTPKSYQNMMKIRQYILDNEFSLILPCPHSGECGLVDDYCNFSVRVTRTKMSRQVKSGRLNYEDEKYYYLVFRKNASAQNTNNSIVIRRPVYRKGCVDLKLCNQDGSIKSKTLTKSDKENYKLAKELKHGDLCNFSKLKCND